MSISGISGVGALWPTPATSVGPSAATPATSATGTSAASGSGGSGFSDLMGNALDSLANTQGTADSLAEQAATGGLTNVQDYMVASEQANLDTQLTVAVRNNAVQAFQNIMGMQL